MEVRFTSKAMETIHICKARKARFTFKATATKKFRAMEAGGCGAVKAMCPGAHGSAHGNGD